MTDAEKIEDTINFVQHRMKNIGYDTAEYLTLLMVIGKLTQK